MLASRGSRCNVSVKQIQSQGRVWCWDFPASSSISTLLSPLGRLSDFSPVPGRCLTPTLRPAHDEFFLPPYGHKTQRPIISVHKSERLMNDHNIFHSHPVATYRTCPSWLVIPGSTTIISAAPGAHTPCSLASNALPPFEGTDGSPHQKP